MRLGSWLEVVREVSVSQRKKERERQAIVRSFDSKFVTVGTLCAVSECGLSFNSYVPLCFVYISKGRKEECLFLKSSEAQWRQCVDSGLACR